MTDKIAIKSVCGIRGIAVAGFTLLAKTIAMKMFRPLPFLLALCLCAGCFDITEEFWFNKDRSGRYEISVDFDAMSDLINMAKQFAPQNDSLGAQATEPLDTVFYLSTLPDSIKRLFPHPELADRTSFALKSQTGFKLTFALDFREVGEVARFRENFSAIDPLNHDGIASMAIYLRMFGGFQTDPAWQGKTFSLHGRPVQQEEELNPWGNTGVDNPMLKMMLGKSNYRQRFHFDGRIRSVNGRKHKGKSHSVEIEHPFLDVMRDPSILSCTIKLKR